MKKEGDAAKQRRTNYLINKPLQFAYAGIAIWLLLIAILLAGALTYYTTLNTILSQMEQTQMFSTDAYETVRSINSLLLKRVGSMLVLLTLLTGILEIFYLHRVAGPVYRMEKLLRTYTDGGVFVPIRLRDRDFFKPLAETINNLVDSKQQKDARIQELLQIAERYPDLREKIEQVRAIR